ncbi:DUF4189 domain-containing protein [Janibacter terrae]|uniref:DUF4189 domain-containing protein n=1 Tax=Janibacter terrae TaxID=103817 RepID=UPI000836CD9C|nr:DUF4189 domain-containing protein [Janibacter terrae]
MKSVITRAAVASAAVALTATTLATAPAGAAVTQDSSSAATNYYGAIALNTRTLAVGTSVNAKYRSSAQSAALKRCKQYSYSSYCKNVVWVSNGCAAVAVKYDSKNRPVRYGSAYGKYKWPTVRLAKKRAMGTSTAGTVKTRVYLCTTRYY